MDTDKTARNFSSCYMSTHVRANIVSSVFICVYLWLIFFVGIGFVFFDIGFSVGKRFEFGAAKNRDQKILARELRQVRRHDVLVDLVD